MTIIKVDHLYKTFRIKEKEKGFKGSLKAIFKPKYKTIKAVNNISFEVEKGEIIAFIVFYKGLKRYSSSNLMIAKI